MESGSTETGATQIAGQQVSVNELFDTTAPLDALSSDVLAESGTILTADVLTSALLDTQPAGTQPLPTTIDPSVPSQYMNVCTTKLTLPKEANNWKITSLGLQGNVYQA